MQPCSRRPGVTVNAAVLATAVGIETCLEAYIGTAIASDDRFGSVTKILCSAAGPLVSVRVDVDNIEVINIDVQSFEPIGRTPGSPPPTDGLAALRSLVNDRSEFLLRRHILSSHEHIILSNQISSCRSIHSENVEELGNAAIIRQCFTHH